MKKLLFAALLLLLPMGFVQAIKLKPWRLGIEGGIDVDQFKTNESLFKPENRMGWFVGPKLKMSLLKSGIGFDVAALYHHNNLEYGEMLGIISTGNETKDDVHTLVAPLNLRYNFTQLKVVTFYVAAGPQFNWKINDIKSPYQSIDLEDYYFDMNFGAGIEVVDRIQVGFTYKVPLQDMGKINGTTLKENRWTIRLGVFF